MQKVSCLTRVIFRARRIPLVCEAATPSIRGSGRRQMTATIGPADLPNDMEDVVMTTAGRAALPKLRIFVGARPGWLTRSRPFAKTELCAPFKVPVT